MVFPNAQKVKAAGKTNLIKAKVTAMCTCLHSWHSDVMEF